MSDLKPKFIYFDLDDTLLDHKKAEQNGLKDIHSHFTEFNDISLDELLSTYHKINKGLWEEYGRGEIDRHILHRRRFQETFIELGINSSLYKEAGKVYMNYYRNHWEWIGGAKEAFDKIRSKYDVGIITNGFAETQWMKIKQFGFEEMVSQIVISEEIGAMKPHPKIFDYSTELVGIERSDILYVGDSLTSDVEGGKAAGWKVAWYTVNPTKEGEALADLVFNDFGVLIDRIKA
ncbi:MAG: HAD-IA family hydrolase [Balneola sp.]|nr:HAD-IA family hydrolase [Balneola sp.]MBO6649396.1 HAD-IA family hydrolase [Balneola sp.]MBO6711211.1 HAD-IA family hydrolase [Balneola sp.]MBO6800674.1 HAD-IA family hydrolase [Balneola sp.]MBO6869147.1 HAD-IA family hydrolase [Balneola sp.]